MNVLFVSSLFAFFAIALPFWFMPYLTPKSIQFGVRVPRDHENDPAIGEIRKSFHQLLFILSAIIFLLLIMLPFYLELYSFGLFGMLLEIVLSYLIYFRSFRKLHKVKESQHWYSNVRQGSSAVYKMEKAPRESLLGFFFIIPAIIVIIVTLYIGMTVYPTLPSMIPTHFGANGQPNQYSVKSIGSVFSMVFVQIGTTIGMFILGYIIVRTKQDIDVSRPITSYEQQERFKWYTRDSLYLLVSAINISMMSSSFSIWGLMNRQYLLLYSLLPVLLGSGVLIVVLMSFGQMGSRLNVPGMKTENSGISNVNDDRQWKGGVFDYNRQDSSILVPKRFGIGWTFNFARPASWIILAILVALPLIIVFVVRLLK